MTNSQSAERLKRPVIKPVLDLPLSKAWARAWEGLFAHRFAIYICVILLASVGSYAHWVRANTIFACQANGYSPDRYLAYCNGANYADYEHGAFQFNLEPSVQRSVRNAQVLFLGNSHLQIAFSTAPTAQWFKAHSVSYYLMGFGYYENAIFEGQLLRRIRPRANVYVINVDKFFVRHDTIRAQKALLHTILDDPNARQQYEAKRLWQHVHELVCKPFAWLCGHQYAIFRSRTTGVYYTKVPIGWHGGPVSYEPAADQQVADGRIAVARRFLSRFTRGKCVILTTVPTVGTEIGTAQAIARGVGLKLVTPGILPGLRTFDGSHLDPASARRWSQAFLKVAGPLIQLCLDKRETAERQGAMLTTTARLDAGPATIR